MTRLIRSHHPRQRKDKGARAGAKEGKEEMIKREVEAQTNHQHPQTTNRHIPKKTGSPFVSTSTAGKGVHEEKTAKCYTYANFV